LWLLWQLWLLQLLVLDHVLGCVGLLQSLVDRRRRNGSPLFFHLRNDLGDLNVQAELIKIHLHTPSEHDLDSHDLGGEIHLIHKITKPVGGSELFVLGVFFNEVKKKSTSKSDDKHETLIHSAFFKMWSNAVGKSEQKEETASEIQNIDPRNLLPDTGRWFLYEGSLTTEPYSEIVSWLVFKEPLEILS
jgi:carbonic anhydrase